VQLEAVVDTGFNGSLAFSGQTASLGLTWLYRQQGMLADGTVQVFDVYEGTGIWDGQARMVDVDEVDTDQLLGMAMLLDHELRIKVVNGGDVIIERLPAPPPSSPAPSGP
jgi:predicted aspartyl protease